MSSRSSSNGNIRLYVDSISYYSIFGLHHLLSQKSTLATYGISITIIPLFIGGAMALAKNIPPGENEVKRKYALVDMPRTRHFFGLDDKIRARPPKWFPYLSILPMRAMCVLQRRVATASGEDKVKAEDDLEKAFWMLMEYSWGLDKGLDVSRPENLLKALSEVFSEDEAKQIIDATKEPDVKAQLETNTKEAVSRGSFGAPFFWVTNKKGEEAPFFGSDRFPQIWDFLGLDVQRLQLRPASSSSSRL